MVDVVVLCRRTLVRHKGIGDREAVVRCPDALRVAYGLACATGSDECLRTDTPAKDLAMGMIRMAQM